MASLVTATLSEPERRALDRLVARLERELGDDLHAVWLYGSRARGEPQHPEGSDIDLLVVTSADAEERIKSIVMESAEAEGVYYGWFSVFVHTPGWVADRRAIEAFYIQEVDRDKIVLAGGEVEASRGFDVREDGDGVKARTREYLDYARYWLPLARQSAHGAPAAAIADAYYVVLNAARAALSEEDRFTRSHKGTWQLASKRLVTTGRIPSELHRRASSLQESREDVHYGPRSRDAPIRRFTPEEAQDAVRTAEDYLHAVEELLRSPPSRPRAPR
jgi:predicted nucleotidyltransferase/uncharacterized protein (UPF0332 family)